MDKKSQRKKVKANGSGSQRHKIEMGVLFTITLLLLLVVHLYSLLNTPASASTEAVLLVVERGSSFKQVASGLKEKGLIGSSFGFNLAAKFGGAHTRIKAGEYEFTPSLTPSEILAFLVAGKTKKHKITFPEGFSLKSIADTLLQKGLLKNDGSTFEEFLSRVYDPGYAKELGLTGPSLEGYLFPDTYHFDKVMSVDEIIGVMVRRFKSVYDEFVREGAEKAGLSMQQVVTLASIIEKETGVTVEMPIISSVFHNRLRSGYRLQSDPTVIYGIVINGDFDGDLKRKHLRARTPYNTYAIHGLPLGPIASPGKEALIAAVYPANGEYLYFVSKNDGTHKFSETLREHNRAVKIYQKDFFRRKNKG